MHPLRLEFIGKRTFRLTEPFCYSGQGIEICLPAGATTDFASIPRALWLVLDPLGPWAEIAVIHDYLYRSGIRSREIADAILLQGLRECGAAKWEIWAIYLGVRCFGWMSYNDKGESE